LNGLSIGRWHPKGPRFRGLKKLQVIENKREGKNKWGAFDSPCITPVLRFPMKRAKSGTPTSGTIFDCTEKGKEKYVSDTLSLVAKYDHPKFIINER
jgi:hypothetical protein